MLTITLGTGRHGLGPVRETSRGALQGYPPKRFDITVPAFPAEFVTRQPGIEPGGRRCARAHLRALALK